MDASFALNRVAAGYSVVATASPKNFDFVRSLGAAHAFDYKSKRLAQDVIAALRGKTVVGALAIGAGSTFDCLDILAHSRGRKFIASASSPVSFEALGDGDRITLPIFLTLLRGLLPSSLRTWWKSRRVGVTAKFFDASSVVDSELGRYIYRDYLPNALASGAFRPAPPPRVVGDSLGEIQTAFDIHRKGVSATKIVVALG